MSKTHRSDGAYIPGYHHSGDRGLGVRGADVPSTGDNGPGLLYPGLSLPVENEDEFRVTIDTVPAGVTIYVDEDSSFAASAVAPGSYVGTYSAYKNGVLYGSSTYTLSFGDGLTGTLTLDAILPVGQVDGVPVPDVALGRAVAPRIALGADGKLYILF